MFARNNWCLKSGVAKKNAGVGLHEVLAVVERVDGAQLVVAAELFTSVLVLNARDQVDEVALVHRPGILEAALALCLT